MAKPKDPFTPKLSEADTATLTRRLVDAIRIGQSARTKVMEDGGQLDFSYSLYEQQPQMGISRLERPSGGADLTSPIGTQMVDTLTAIACKTVFVDPFWIVEGIGKDAKKAPAVEEFLHWRFEEMRGQAAIVRAISQAFIEEGAVVEACEDAQDIHRTKTVKAKIQRGDDGLMLLDGKTGKPMPQYGDDGEPVPAEDEDGAATDDFVECAHKFTETKRRGASLRLHSLKDFMFLPGHATDPRDVWGRAVRFWMALDDLRQAEEYGTYSNIGKLGTAAERQQRTEHDRNGTNVDVDTASDKAEKELWRVQFYANLTGKMCFYVATVSVEHECIIRLREDWIGRWRTVYLNPYPRNNSVYGYSLILHKLLTTIEGHTAWRNMNCDRGMLKANTPMMRLNGSLWEPSIQPIGPGETITVGDMREVAPMPYEDVSQHAFTREREFYEEAARIVGVSDILASVNPKVQRTLGENEMVTEQSFTRSENPIRNIQEAFEDLGELIHVIEVEALKDVEDGMAPPASIAQNVRFKTPTPDDQSAEDDAAFAFTADMLAGRFRFKPRGSVETADPNRRINNWVNSVRIGEQLAKTNPLFAAKWTSPQVGDALLQQYVDMTKPRDKQAFLAPLPPPPMPMLPGGMPGPPAGAGAPVAPGGPGAPPSFGGEQLLQQLTASLPAQGGVQ